MRLGSPPVGGRNCAGSDELLPVTDAIIPGIPPPSPSDACPGRAGGPPDEFGVLGLLSPDWPSECTEPSVLGGLGDGTIGTIAPAASTVQFSGCGRISCISCPVR